MLDDGEAGPGRGVAGTPGAEVRGAALLEVGQQQQGTGDCRVDDKEKDGAEGALGAASSRQRRQAQGLVRRSLSGAGGRRRKGAAPACWKRALGPGRPLRPSTESRGGEGPRDPALGRRLPVGDGTEERWRALRR